MGLDLFTPVVPPERFHPSFKKVIDRANIYDRQVLEQWVDGFVDRDGKFVIEFQTTFDSSFWELYLHAVFKELGMQSDFSFPRPDFCVLSPIPFVVEATVALHARGTPSVTETNPLEIPKEFTEFNRQAILRLSNSVRTKYKKYVESYSRLPQVAGKPFVIALAPFDRPHFQLQAQRAIEALLYRYYVDEDKYKREHPQGGVALLAEELSFVEKDSGERIPLGLFCDTSMSEVSAVIQSTSGTWSKVRAMGDDPDVSITAIYENRAQGGELTFHGPRARYQESILDGLRVYHNPYASHPLDPDLFGHPTIFQATSNRPVSVILMNECRRNLVCRTAMTFPRGAMAKYLETVPSDKSFWYARR